jgi:hypothetical protein
MTARKSGMKRTTARKTGRKTMTKSKRMSTKGTMKNYSFAAYRTAKRKAA